MKDLPDLPDGIPSVQNYKALLESDFFRSMEQYSDNFLSSNKSVLEDYMKKWVADPLHQWSRQWEYPFVYAKVREQARRKPRLKILDAGSGVTFFPYFLNESLNASLHCLDYDRTLSAIFDDIKTGRGKIEEFSAANLSDIPYEDKSFDTVYCISVLEHTDDYEKIIKEFLRVLRPDGSLVVTFDVSLDGTRDISVDRAGLLLSSLAKYFKTDSTICDDFHACISDPNIFTTRTAYEIDPNLLPWKAPGLLSRIKSFVTSGRIGSWPPLLSVVCLKLTPM